MASVSWPSVSAVPDGTTIGTNSQGELTVLQAPLVSPPAGQNWLEVPASPPVNLSATASTTGGSLAAGTYYYVVTALDAAGGETTPSAEVSATVSSGTTGSVTLTFNPQGGMGFNVYRGTSSGGENVYYNISSVKNTASSLDQVKWTDTGAAATSGTPPDTNTAVQMDFNPQTGRLRWAKEPELGISWGGYYGEYTEGSFALVDSPGQANYRWAIGQYANGQFPLYGLYGTDATRTVLLQPGGGRLLINSSSSLGVVIGYNAPAPGYYPYVNTFNGIYVGNYNRVFGQNLTAQTTTSTTPVAATVNWGGTSGTSVSFEPKFSGRVKITAHFAISNNTLGDGVTVNLQNGTTVLVSETYTQEGLAGNVHDTVLVYEYGTGVVAGLTKGTTYTFSVNFNAVTGGTASLVVYGVVIEEF